MKVNSLLLERAEIAERSGFVKTKNQKEVEKMSVDGLETVTAGSLKGKRGFWESRIQEFVAESPALLCQMLNAFYPGKFVVGTQTHCDYAAKKWVAFVYYKVKG
jgi:hypothetical protein